MTKRALNWLPVGLGVAFLLFLAYLQRDRAITGQNDFVAFYAGAKLAGTSALYSRPANQAVIRSILGFALENVTFIRPPFYAALLKPLSWLPYRVAYALFSAITLSCVLWFAFRFSKECPALPFFASMSIPILAALCGGQDTPLLLAILGASILLTRRTRDFAAGLVLSLCAIKFHLFLFLPLMFAMKKRWRTMGGLACGTALLTALGVLVAGADSIRGFVNILRDPWINASATVMPNIHGLVAVLHGGVALEVLLVALVFAAFVWIAWGTDNYELLLGASLVCGLLVSFHSELFDDVLLLPVFVAVAENCRSVPLRALSALILTPVPYFMILAGAPYSAIFPLSLLLFLGMFCAVRGHRAAAATAELAGART